MRNENEEVGAYQKLHNRIMARRKQNPNPLFSQDRRQAQELLAEAVSETELL
jgi:hypothetical protein